MNSRRIGFGIFLVTAGILMILLNLGILSWSVFYTMFRLWPLLIILAGVNVMFRNNIYVKVVSWLLFLAIVIGCSYYFSDGIPFVKPGPDKHVVIERAAETKNGRITLAMGGLKLNVGSTSTNLLDADVPENYFKNGYSYTNVGDTASIEFENRNVPMMNTGSGRSCTFALNNDIAWDMNLKLGAAQGTIDMSDLKMKTVDMDSGAVDLTLRLGNKSESTDVKVNTGASQINFEIPRDSGVRIQVTGALNSTNFNEFNMVKDGNTYTSPGYSEAKNKVDIDVHMGVGNFTLKGY